MSYFLFFRERGSSELKQVQTEDANALELVQDQESCAQQIKDATVLSPRLPILALVEGTTEDQPGPGAA